MFEEFDHQPGTKKQVTLEKAQKILQEHGTIVTLEMAEEILKFLNKLSEIAIAVYFDGHRSTLNEFEPSQPIEKRNIKTKKVKKSRI